MTLNLTFKALSDPTRRKILDLLMDKDLTAGEIADHFQMTKPAISHHLSLLKQGGLVWDERQGQHVIYSINTTVLQEVMKWFMQFNNGKGKGEENL
ncbi:autorepressor SdpR family transcription factor [Lysinibacillus sp. NPDC093190]|uniref:autorepressor SdpR family transcription factor n=1 Tax=Lysinibacillus sp. NPDC093190 TaxID=3390575 RepID=UPI003D017FB8